MRNIVALAALPLALAFLGGCGGSGHTTPPPSSNVPVTVSIFATTPTGEEALPAGVNLISVQPTITGACLLTSSNTSITTCPTGQAIFPSSGGGTSTVQLSGLSNPSQPDVLSNTNVTAGTYTGIMVTFNSPLTATISVDPGDSFTDGTNTCDNTTGTTPLICQISPVVSTTSVTYTFPTALTLTAGTPTSIQIGLDLDASLVSTGSAPATLSFNPTVVVTQGTVGSDGNLIDVNNVTGTVQSINSTTITVIDSATGLPVTLNLGSSTMVTNYPMNGTTCPTANALTCPQVGDVVTVAYGVSNANPTVSTATTINGNPGITNTGGFLGTIVATTPTPEVVVTAVPAGNTVSGLAVGQVLDLTFSSTAVFSNSTGATLPVGTFGAAGDLVVGQNVLVDTDCATGCVYTAPVPPAPGSVEADAIELLPSSISGTVGNLNSPTFTVNGLNSFYTGNGITGINGTASASAIYAGSLTQFTDMTAGNTYYYNGFLVNSGTVGTPDFYATGFYGAPATADAVKTTTR